MAEFNADFFRVLALGPNPSQELLALCSKRDEFGQTPVLSAYARRNNWSTAQKDNYEKSREFLYAAVMLRAAASLVQSGQEANSVPQEQKLAESSIGLRFRSRTAHVSANMDAKGFSGHEMENPHLPAVFKAAAAATDHRIILSTFGLAEDYYASEVLEEFRNKGLACPP